MTQYKSYGQEFAKPPGFHVTFLNSY